MADSVSTEERGFKDGNDYPGTGYGGVSESEPPHHKIHSSDEPLPKPSAGYGDEEGAYEESTPADQSAGTGVGGAKSDYGNTAEGTESFDHPTSDQTQFGLEGKTASYGKEASDPRESYESGTGTGDATGYGATPTGSALDETPLSSGETQPAGDGFGPEDTSAKHGAKKEGFMTKLKEKLPGHKKSTDATEFGGETDTTSPTTPPKKGFVTKLKEKLPGHHDSSTDV